MAYLVQSVVGLDLSLTGTGIAVWNKDKFELLTVDTSKKTGLVRLHYILEEVIRSLPDKPLVVIEDFAFSRGTGAYSLGGLGYLVRWSLWTSNIPFILVKPNQLKKFLTGKGNVD